MLMEKMLSSLELIAIQGAAKPYMLNCLGLSPVKFLHPSGLAVVDFNIQLLQYTEQRAWRRPNNQEGIFLFDLGPSALPVIGLCEIIAVGEVH